MNGPIKDAENVTAFVEDETKSTYGFLSGILAATALVGLLFICSIAAIIIYQLTR